MPTIFYPDHEVRRIKNFIEYYMLESGCIKGPAIVGLSGGKDSTITAALCVEALGKDRVIGVTMPDNNQSTELAREIGEYLDINLERFDIGYLTKEILDWRDSSSAALHWNLAPRIRMALLYAVANDLGGRVACTCNMSETYVGYDTRWGDQCGDFAPLQNYTATEVKRIGRSLRVPDKFVEQVPSDGLCGMTDEERWGFTYKELDAYLRGEYGSVLEIPEETIFKIDQMHMRASYKIQAIKIPATEYFPKESRSLTGVKERYSLTH